ncbi:MAG TPA: glycosyltransferase family 1 protein [Candidatus Bathyarchaeia archaeon]|nr:glycosyltransferase family 1 protein [Candidatus Bathyarchaeia archaeon]
MRVLYDHQVFSLQNAGGASRYFYELARYLAAVPEAETEVWLGMNGTVYPFSGLDRGKVHVSGLPEWLPPGRPRYLVNEVWSRTKALLNGKVDVYHPTTYMRTPTIRARRAVATHHDCTHERFPEYFAGAKTIFWARRQMLPSVDAVICVSEACRQDLLRFYQLDPAKTRVVHHGVTQLPRSAEAAAQLKGRLRRDYLLYVGMRAKFKNFDGLLQAFHDSRLGEAYDLLVLGASPLTGPEKKLIARLGLGGFVICLPRVSDAILAEAYARARLFVYPSFNEGFGFPPLEAMSLDCPVLASNIAALVEVCGDAPFYFDPSDQGAFSRELLRAACDEKARREAVLRGREVAARYTWDKCGRETLAVYRECQ